MRQNMKRTNPILCVLWGDPCIGKSTLANHFAASTTAIVVDKDDFKDVLYPSFIDDFEATDKACYQSVLAIARRNLFNGVSVVFDDILNREWVYHDLCRLSRESASELVFVHCSLTSYDVWRSRLASRESHGHTSHRLTTLEDVLIWQKTRRQPFERPEGVQLALSLQDDVEETISDLLAKLREI